MLTMGGRLVLDRPGDRHRASLASTRLLRSQLFGVEPADPLAYAAVVLVLGVVALAGLLRARASRRRRRSDGGAAAGVKSRR